MIGCSHAEIKPKFISTPRPSTRKNFPLSCASSPERGSNRHFSSAAKGICSTRVGDRQDSLQRAKPANGWRLFSASRAERRKLLSFVSGGSFIMHSWLHNRCTLARCEGTSLGRNVYWPGRGRLPPAKTVSSKQRQDGGCKDRSPDRIE